MDINNQQQTNTFVGGMDTDTSDMYLDSSKYRYAENVRIITDKDSNSGELRIIEGTTLFTRLDDTHTPVLNRFNGSKILAMTSVRDLGVLILKKNDKWCIVTFKESDGVPVIKQKTKWLNEKIWAYDMHLVCAYHVVNLVSIDTCCIYNVSSLVLTVISPYMPDSIAIFCNILNFCVESELYAVYIGIFCHSDI